MVSGTLGIADIISEERTDYVLTTLGEGRSRSQGKIALGSAHVLLKSVTELRAAKARRVGADTYRASFECEVDDITYALERLVEYYDSFDATEIANDRAAGIYAKFVEYCLADLRQSAQLIDAELED